MLHAYFVTMILFSNLRISFTDNWQSSTHFFVSLRMLHCRLLQPTKPLCGCCIVDYCIFGPPQRPPKYSMMRPKWPPRWLPRQYVLASWSFFCDLLLDLRFQMNCCFWGTWNASMFVNFWSKSWWILDRFQHHGMGHEFLVTVMSHATSYLHTYIHMYVCTYSKTVNKRRGPLYP